MRALVFHGPRSLSVEDRPDPIPGPDEVLIRIAATGICGSDLHGYLGETGRRAPGMVMGHEMAGTVDSVGNAVDDSTLKGSQVTVNPVLSCGTCDACEADLDNRCRARRVIGVTPDVAGGYADAIAVPARNVVILDPDHPVEFGTLVEPMAVGYHAVRRSGCEPGQAVAVLGGGAIGAACVLGATRIGAGPIFLAEPLAHRRTAVAALGAIAVDPKSQSLSEKVFEVTGIAEVSIVFDAVGSSSSLRSATDVCAPGGTIVLVGMGSPEIQLSVYDLVVPERAVIGTFCYTDSHFRETARWVSSRSAELAGFIEGRVGFDEVVERFDKLAIGEDHALKTVLLTDQSKDG